MLIAMFYYKFITLCSMRVGVVSFAVGMVLFVSGSAQAAKLQLLIVDPQGTPLPQVVAYALPRGKTVAAPSSSSTPPAAVIEQVDRQFVPKMTVIQTGTAVRFPNRDTVRHHVYSFSPAKNFSLKLYVGEPPEPVFFDKAGDVVLGCNIHDHMLAYVKVVDTPHFAISDAAGRAVLEGLPAGEYDVMLWHPQQRSPWSGTVVRLSADSVQSPRLTLDLAPVSVARPTAR